MKYVPQLCVRRDSLGNPLTVGVLYDEQSGTYVAEIRAGMPVKMVSGMKRKPIVATGEGETPSAAADYAVLNYDQKQKTKSPGSQGN